MKTHFCSIGMIKWYAAGFVLSLLLTLAAYFAVVEDLFNKDTLVVVVVGLAILQTFVQLLCFLKIGRENKPHWNTLIFLFAVSVVLMLVLGSMWIMYHLDYRLMSMDMNPCKLRQEGI